MTPCSTAYVPSVYSHPLILFLYIPKGLLLLLALGIALWFHIVTPGLPENSRNSPLKIFKIRPFLPFSNRTFFSFLFFWSHGNTVRDCLFQTSLWLYIQANGCDMCNFQARILKGSHLYSFLSTSQTILHGSFFSLSIKHCLPHWDSVLKLILSLLNPQTLLSLMGSAIRFISWIEESHMQILIFTYISCKSLCSIYPTNQLPIYFSIFTLATT